VKFPFGDKGRLTQRENPAYETRGGTAPPQPGGKRLLKRPKEENKERPGARGIKKGRLARLGKRGMFQTARRGTCFEGEIKENEGTNAGLSPIQRSSFTKERTETRTCRKKGGDPPAGKGGGRRKTYDKSHQTVKTKAWTWEVGEGGTIEERGMASPERKEEVTPFEKARRGGGG